MQKSGRAFCTKDSHYLVKKNAEILNSDGGKGVAVELLNILINEKYIIRI